MSMADPFSCAALLGHRHFVVCQYRQGSITSIRKALSQEESHTTAVKRTAVDRIEKGARIISAGKFLSGLI